MNRAKIILAPEAQERAKEAAKEAGVRFEEVCRTLAGTDAFVVWLTHYARLNGYGLPHRAADPDPAWLGAYGVIASMIQTLARCGGPSGVRAAEKIFSECINPNKDQ